MSILSLEDRIENIIMSEVFVEFAKGGIDNFKKGLSILRRLYMKYYNNINDLEVKRILLYNMALAEHQISPNSSEAKFFIKLIKSEIECDKQYMVDEKLKYTRLLSMYAEIFNDEIDDDEYKSINLFNSETYREIGSYGEYYIALSNVYEKNKEYKKILNLIEEAYKLKDENVSYFLGELLKNLKNSSLHKRGLEIIENHDKNASSL